MKYHNRWWPDLFFERSDIYRRINYSILHTAGSENKCLVTNRLLFIQLWKCTCARNFDSARRTFAIQPKGGILKWGGGGNLHTSRLPATNFRLNSVRIPVLIVFSYFIGEIPLTVRVDGARWFKIYFGRIEKEFYSFLWCIQHLMYNVSCDQCKRWSRWFSLIYDQTSKTQLNDEKDTLVNRSLLLQMQKIKQLIQYLRCITSKNKFH